MSAGIQRRPLPGITTLIEKFPLILFFALLVWLSLQSPFFLSWQNISMMLVQSVPLAILCFGLVCVIAVGGDDVVSGGIDLSLPAIAVLGVALLSLGMAEWNTPYLALFLLLIAVSLACGAVNATLVLAAGLPPLLATLSTSVAFTGLTDLLTGQRRIAVNDPLMVAFRDNDLFGIPLPLIYLLAVFALFQFLLHHSRFGQHLQAVGGNRDMAQMSGLNVRRLTIIVWLLAGIAAGLAILPLLSHAAAAGNRPRYLYRRGVFAASGGLHLGGATRRGTGQCALERARPAGGEYFLDGRDQRRPDPRGAGGVGGQT